VPLPQKTMRMGSGFYRVGREAHGCTHFK
jgi:hypothetical protein